jgi:folate-binding protein YgfZ
MTVPTTATSPLLDLPGAVAGAGVDAAVAAHYGDPMREQRRLTEAAGFVDLSHRGVFTITGADRCSWLHNLTTQHLESIEPGQSSTALFLSPQGRVEHVMYLVATDDAIWAHTEPGAAPALVAFLDSMRFMLRVEVTDRTAEFAVVWRPGAPGSGPHVTRAGVDSLGGHEVFLPRQELPGLAGAAEPDADERPAGLWAYEALRIAAHVPRWGLDTDDRAIPNEMGWLGSAVHLDKGCYRGQETVARVNNLGRPPRRLVFLHLDGSVDDLPAHGSPVRLDERDVGFIGSSVRHFELGPIALALVRRTVPVDATLVDAGDTAPVTAAQEVIVPPDIGLHVRRR